MIISAGFRPVDWDRTFNTKAIALFAHADYDITEQLKIQGGIRYEKDWIDYTWVFNPIAAAQKVTSDGVVRNFAAIPGLINTSKNNADFVNFDVGLQYKVHTRRHGLRYLCSGETGADLRCGTEHDRHHRPETHATGDGAGEEF